MKVQRRIARVLMRRSKRFKAAIAMVDSANASVDVSDAVWVREYLEEQGLTFLPMRREGDRIHGVVRRRELPE